MYTNNFDRDHLQMLANRGVFIMKPEINPDKTSIISVNTINNKIEYFEEKKIKYTQISILDKETNQLLFNIEICDGCKIVREYRSNDNNEVILELITTGG